MGATAPEVRNRSGLARAVAILVTWWALSGGLLLLAVVAVNTLSVLGAVVWRPFPGDFELTEVGVAVAAFMFLPYTQIVDANVTADIFTARAPPRWVALFKLAASAVALAFACLMVWRNYAGMLDQRQYGYTTAILQFPTWLAFIPIVASLALLVLAAAVTLMESGRAVATGRPHA
jgi:TRAP-type C4-dicarboxylate transport system permease small subunit